MSTVKLWPRRPGARLPVKLQARLARDLYDSHLSRYLESIRPGGWTLDHCTAVVEDGGITVERVPLADAVLILSSMSGHWTVQITS